MSSSWRLEWAEIVRRDTSLSAMARLVGQCLALDFANGKTGLCNPSRDRIAAHIGASVATIKRALVDLAERGYLDRTGSRGRGRTNAYTFRTPGAVIPLHAANPADKLPAPEADSGCDPVVKTGHTRPANTDGKGVKSERKRGHKRPAPYMNLGKNHSAGARETTERPSELTPFLNHRFTDAPSDGLAVISLDNHTVLNAWSEWLKRNNLPKLCHLPIRQCDPKSGRVYLYLPTLRPPQSETAEKEARWFFATILDTESAARAAQ